MPQVDEQSLKQALAAVLCGRCSFREASAEFNISVTTLADYKKKIVLNHGGAIPEVSPKRRQKGDVVPSALCLSCD